MELPDEAVVSRLRGDKVVSVGSCKRCRFDWCLSCRFVAHPGLTCAENERMVGKWQEFMTLNPHLFADSALAKALRQRYDEDKLTADMVKRCPHCKKGPIYKIDGCDAMVCPILREHRSPTVFACVLMSFSTQICGADALDKRTSNIFGDWVRYRGCGKSFFWSKALPCRPEGFRGKPGGSVALAESVNTEKFEIFFKRCLVDDTKIARLLITVGCLPKSPVLLFALRQCPDQQTVRHLIAARAQEVGQITVESPLLLACKKQWGECALALVAAKASATFRSTEGKTPLLQACASMCGATTGHPEAIAALLAAGADPRECLPNGKSPLLLACDTPASPECVRLLVEAGAALNTRRGDGQTPLLLACANNCVEVVAHLLRGKADANTGVGDHTPLIAACKRSDPRCVRPLLEAKANAQVTDSRGRSPIQLIGQQSKASLPQRRDTSCVKALLRAKAYVSVEHGDWQVVVRDPSELMSALDLACDDVTVVHNNCLDALAALLEAGADPSGHAGQVVVLSLNLSKRRTRPLQRLLAVDDDESSFRVRFSFFPPDNRTHVRLSQRQLVECGPSDALNEIAHPTPHRTCHTEHEELFGQVHRGTPHGKSAGCSEFWGRSKVFSKAMLRMKACKRGDRQGSKRQSKPKRAWQSLRGKRTYEREWSRR